LEDMIASIQLVKVYKVSLIQAEYYRNN